LLFAVVALGALAWWGGGEPDDVSFPTTDQPLFADLESSRVVGIRVDYTDRDLVFELAKGESGNWSLIDPIEFAADAGPVRQLLDLVSRGRAELAPIMEPSAVDLEPALVEIELTEDFGEGDLRRRVIRLGAPDFDGAQVFATLHDDGAAGTASTDAAVYRVPRALYSVVDLPLVEWREKRLLRAISRDVIVFRRRGTLPEADGSIDPAFAGELDLDFELAGNEFYATYPQRVRLHPSAIEPLRLAVAGARARRFLADEITDLARYGLEPPSFTIEVELRDGTHERIRVGAFALGEGEELEDRRWTALVEGRPVVYELRTVDVRILTAPMEQLFDYDLINVLDSGVFGLEVSLDGEGLDLERDGSGWTVRSLGAEPGEAQRADDGGVGDVLAQVLQAELAVFLVEPEHLDQPLTGRIAVQLEDGSTVGVDLGPRTEYRGLEGRLVRRDGEDLWALVVDDLDSLAVIEPSSLRSPFVFRLDELQQARISITSELGSATWQRDPQQGLWSRTDRSGEDRQFALQVESVLGPRVRRWLDIEPATALQDAITVEVVDRAGRVRGFELGTLAVEGESLTVVREGQRIGEMVPRLAESLGGLLGG